MFALLSVGKEENPVESGATARQAPQAAQEDINRLRLKFDDFL
jgi:hypothetical protein